VIASIASTHGPFPCHSSASRIAPSAGAWKCNGSPPSTVMEGFVSFGARCACLFTGVPLVASDSILCYPERTTKAHSRRLLRIDLQFEFMMPGCHFRRVVTLTAQELRFRASEALTECLDALGSMLDIWGPSGQGSRPREARQSICNNLLRGEQKW